ncbi:MAG TPA: hypothetical protein VG797_03425 [Phycisphaerales bacterium]|nr:hypothetical protein [Phycisphaerales bacterium]
MAEPSRTESSSTPVRLPYGPVTLAELTAGLSWPRLLRSAILALRPSRLVIAYLIILFIDGITSAFSSALGERAALVPNELWRAIESGWDRAAVELSFFNISAGLSSLVIAFVDVPIEMAIRAPWTFAGYVLLLLPFIAILGAAISRSVALEVGPHLDGSPQSAIGFALVRWRSILGAYLIPPAIIFVLGVLIAFLGWLLLRIPGLNVATALLFGLLFPLGLVAAILGVAFFFAKVLLVPAIACDGCDAADAIQRAFAYVLGRPGRMLIYAIVLLAQGLIVVLVAGWIVHLAVDATINLAMSWLPAHHAESLRQHTAIEAPFAAKSVHVWTSAALLLIPAYAASYFFSASTMLYLVLRRVNDGQDEHEIWLPNRTRTLNDDAPVSGGSFE